MEEIGIATLGENLREHRGRDYLRCVARLGVTLKLRFGAIGEALGSTRVQSGVLDKALDAALTKHKPALKVRLQRQSKLHRHDARDMWR